MREDAQDEFRNRAQAWLPPGVERTGNERWRDPATHAMLIRCTRKARFEPLTAASLPMPPRHRRRAWPSWTALLALVAAYFLIIRFLIPWVITGSFG